MVAAAAGFGLCFVSLLRGGEGGEGRQGKGKGKEGGRCFSVDGGGANKEGGGV
jgi:hypothetical protein